ncbi:hypothetical protein [Bacillus mycoides]|uniref:hypothetical protein n=1 Tax=Bacillus mycoides TaxID=1405 RepID=UPI001643255E|nr:hypothetical protein [Bacillus mycoides]
MEEKMFGEMRLLQMGFTRDKIIKVYNDKGYVMEDITTQEQVQEVIDFLELCKEEME